MYFNLKTIFALIFVLVFSNFILKIKIIKKVGNKFNLFFIILILFINFGNDLRRALKYDFERYFNIPLIKFHKEVFTGNEILVESLKIDRKSVV